RAQAWYSRALRLAQGSVDRRAAGQLDALIWRVGRGQSDLAGAADDLRRGRESSEGAGAADELARVLETEGHVQRRRGRLGEGAAATESQVYLEYGLFRERLGQQEEARAYLERTREIFESVGEALERDRVDDELRKLSA